MQIPPETLAEGQVAYRQIQRYQKSSSPVLILVLLLFPLLGAFHVISGTHPTISLKEALVMLPILILLAFFHVYQRRMMKKKSDDAQKRLDLLRDKYGPEIDVVVKKTFSFSNLHLVN